MTRPDSPGAPPGTFAGANPRGLGPGLAAEGGPGMTDTRPISDEDLELLERYRRGLVNERQARSEFDRAMRQASSMPVVRRFQLKRDFEKSLRAMHDLNEVIVSQLRMRGLQP
jgi:hypothetical protein